MKRTFLIYLAANLSAALVTLMVIPLLSRYLGPEDFGKAYIFVTVVWLANTLFGFSMQAIVTVRFKKVEKPQLAKLISTGLTLTLVFNVAAHILLPIFGDRVSDAFNLDLYHLHLALLASFFNVVFLIWQAIQMIQGSVRIYASQQLMNAALSGLATVVFVVYFHLGLDGRIAALTLSHVVMGSIALVQMMRQEFVFARVQLAQLADVIWYGTKMMPHMLGVFLFVGLDRIMVVYFLGPIQAGIYIGAASLAASLAILSTAVNRTVIPILYEKIKSDPDSVPMFLGRFTALVSFAAALSFVFSWTVLPPYIELFLGDGFGGAGRLFSVLLLVQFMFLMYTAASSVVMYTEHNTVLSAITIFTGFFFAGFFVASYRWLGLEATVVSLLAAWILRTVLSYAAAFRSLKHAKAAARHATKNVARGEQE